MSEIRSEAYIGLHVKYSLCLLDFNDTWILSTDFRKILKYQINENPSIGSRLFQRDGHTNINDEAVSRSSQFC